MSACYLIFFLVLSYHKLCIFLIFYGGIVTLCNIVVQGNL
jgi:hypothetical protein